MYIIRRIVAIMSLPLALIMLITGISAVTPSRQKELEAVTEASTQVDFVPVFRFAVATDVLTATRTAIRTITVLTLSSLRATTATAARTPNTRYLQES